MLEMLKQGMWWLGTFFDFSSVIGKQTEIIAVYSGSEESKIDWYILLGTVILHHHIMFKWACLRGLDGGGGVGASRTFCRVPGFANSDWFLENHPPTLGELNSHFLSEFREQLVQNFAQKSEINSFGSKRTPLPPYWKIIQKFILFGNKKRKQSPLAPFKVLVML